ncbi:MAG: AlpA family phage regulatory protein [Desulfovibrionaceae bacterium]|nr:AlpA family phage regulatory protein [Desulfovibrionaceae bacterium]
MQAEMSKPIKLLRLPQVLEKIPYRRSRFLDLVRQGRLPAPRKLPGGRASAWVESEIDDAIERIVNGEVA